MERFVITVGHAVEVLNRMLKTDPAATTMLFQHVGVTCNDYLADDPTIQIGKDEEGLNRVRLIGVINGLFGVDDNNWGLIAMTVDDSGNITRFVELVPNTNGKETK